jgi:hypothetical protein
VRTTVRTPSDRPTARVDPPQFEIEGISEHDITDFLSPLGPRTVPSFFDGKSFGYGTCNFRPADNLSVFLRLNAGLQTSLEHY